MTSATKISSIKERLLGRTKIGGYLIEWWRGDHYPKHLHVFRDGKEIAKVRIPEMLVLTGRLNRQLRKYIRVLIRDKRI